MGRVWQAIRSFVDLILGTVSAFGRNQGTLMSAGLAYYLLLSVSPIFVVAIAVAGMILGRTEAQQALGQRLTDTLGPEVAETAIQLIDSGGLSAGGGAATLIAVVVLFYGATNAFSALQSSLDVIWEIPSSASIRKGLLALLRSRLLAFVMVLGLVGLVLLTTVLDTIGTAAGNLIESQTRIDLDLGSAGKRLSSFALKIVALTTIFKALPTCGVSWRAALPGGILAALLLSFGHTLIGWYVTYGSVQSAYGAAGSIIILLVAFYYSAFVVLLGGQFSKAYAGFRRGDGDSPPGP
jgi:membrane protein